MDKISYLFMVIILLVSYYSANGEILYTVQNNGPNTNRVNVVAMGDGYTESEMTDWHNDIDYFVQYTFEQNEDPFPRYKNFFNVHAIDLISNESGADIPNSDIYVDTALDASYGVYTERLLTTSYTKTTNKLNAAIEGTDVIPHFKLVAVNSSKYGGSGGTYAVYAAGSSYAGELILHEVGHQFGNLADEYWTSSSTYTGPEFTQPNVTNDPSGSKWSKWLGYDDPSNNLSVVGAYEGAKYYAYGAYRPTTTSKMKSLGYPFNSVSREALILSIYEAVDPMDAWMDPLDAQENPMEMWINVIDPNVIDVEWYIDGKFIKSGELFDPILEGYGYNTWDVKVVATDNTDWVRYNFELLTQEIDYTVTINELPGDVNGDDIVDNVDLDLVESYNGLSYAPADFNDDGIVDDLDIAITERYMGIEAASLLMPEPSICFVLVMGLVFVLTRRKYQQALL